VVSVVFEERFFLYKIFTHILHFFGIMASENDWHYGKKTEQTKQLLFKRKKNKGNINALNGLKKVSINITNLFYILNGVMNVLILQ
jgi:hypothetical protein